MIKASMGTQILTDDGVVVAGSDVGDLDLEATLQDVEVLGQRVSCTNGVVSLLYTTTTTTNAHRDLGEDRP